MKRESTEQQKKPRERPSSIPRKSKPAKGCSGQNDESTSGTVSVEIPECSDSGELCFLSDQVAMHIILSAQNGRLSVTGLECERLPWLGDRVSICSELNDFLSSESSKDLSLKIPEDLRMILSNRIQSFLAGYDIRVKAFLKITIEECSKAAVKVVSKPEWLSVVSYETKVTRDSINLIADDITVNLPDELISLKSSNILGANTISLKSKKGFYLDQIELALSKSTIASCDVRKVIRANQWTRRATTRGAFKSV